MAGLSFGWDFSNIKVSGAFTASVRNSGDLQVVTVGAASGFTSSAAKLRPAAGYFTNLGGPNMSGSGSLDGRFKGNGESSFHHAPQAPSTTTGNRS